MRGSRSLNVVLTRLHARRTTAAEAVSAARNARRLSLPRSMLSCRGRLAVIDRAKMILCRERCCSGGRERNGAAAARRGPCRWPTRRVQAQRNSARYAGGVTAH